MKVMFAVKKLDTYEPFGIMLLSSILKKEGHEVIYFNAEYDDIEQQVRNNRPDVLAISTSSTYIKYYLELARRIKQLFKIYVIFGGAHPTFFPEVIQEEAVDAICRGEGEKAFPLFLSNLGKKEMYSVQNMWIKEGSRIIKNDLGQLHQDLDRLPLEDRELVYSSDPYFKVCRLKNFIASRGCPYSCTYCFAHSYRRLYEGKGVYLRWKSPGYFIEEIKAVKENYPLEFIKFLDDIFILNKPWLEEFSRRYRKQINIPFHCWCRADLIDKEVCAMLKQAGCHSINFSIECGNDHIRNNVLKRNMSRRQILDAAGLLRDYGFKFNTQNMIGLPGETMENIYETVDLNAQCKPVYSWASIYMPLPKTELAEYTVKNGYFNGDFNNLPETGYLFSVLNFPDEIKRKINHFHKYFAIRVKFPWLDKMIKTIIRLPVNAVSFAIYAVFYACLVKRNLYPYKTTLREKYLSLKRFLNHLR